ncbi:uncharacterized protein N7483_010347 [Penicillium malachiteum]|uniref:uncharacterized protein n=1 Tax=Penicillium malachiteum TaxID=1324776 RepID=UPI0025496858|nr:uncharacterized protein N7483_010347 [Penicillium malachiteum]KAJ5713166.1 hypothetical protein N7483_010347 [Penicillium malachiteum]
MTVGIGSPSGNVGREPDAVVVGAAQGGMLKSRFCGSWEPCGVSILISFGCEDLGVVRCEDMKWVERKKEI